MKISLAAALLATASMHAVASDWTHDFRAELRLDAIATQADGEVGGPLRRYYDPASIPIGGSGDDSFDAHAAFSAVAWRATRQLEEGRAVQFYAEADFLDGDPEDRESDGDYGVSLRHAYFSGDGAWRTQWLVGQTWSNFMDPRAFPLSVDWFGPIDGAAFRRQPQLRVRRGPWIVSLEQPETQVNPLGGGARATQRGNVPDLVARYFRSGETVYWSAALLLRELAYDDDGIDDDVVGVAASLTGTLDVGENGRWMGGVIAGQGFGRYVGLAAVADVNVETDAELEEVEGVAAHIGYAHDFSERVSGYAFYSRADWDNADEISGGDVVDHTQSLFASVVWNVRDGLDVGVEARWAQRALVDGSEGDLFRLHFMLRHTFD